MDKAHGCPKNLVNGPCGGVDPDGRCEVDRRPCPYVRLLDINPKILETPILGYGLIRKEISTDIKPYSRLMNKIVNGEKAVLVELEPSRRGHGERFLKQALPFRGIADAFSITDNPFGRVQTDPVAAAAFLRINGFNEDLVLHVSCKDRNRASLTSLVLGGLWIGVRNFLALTGDWPQFMAGKSVQPVFDLDSVRLVYMMRLLRDYNLDYMGGKIKEVPLFNIAVAVNPYSIWDIEVRRLKAKRRAGAEFIVSQPILDLASLEKLVKLKQEPLTGDMPIIATIMFLRNEWDSKIVESHFGVKIPSNKHPNIEYFEYLLEEVSTREEISGVEIVFSGDINYTEIIAGSLKKII